MNYVVFFSKRYFVFSIFSKFLLSSLSLFSREDIFLYRKFLKIFFSRSKYNSSKSFFNLSWLEKEFTSSTFYSKALKHMLTSSLKHSSSNESSSLSLHVATIIIIIIIFNIWGVFPWIRPSSPFFKACFSRLKYNYLKAFCKSSWLEEEFTSTSFSPKAWNHMLTSSFDYSSSMESSSFSLYVATITFFFLHSRTLFLDKTFSPKPSQISYIVHEFIWDEIFSS